MFSHRPEAGQQLAGKLKHFSGKDVVVLALPRGGVVTAEPVARTLKAPLDLLIVRKVGHPSQPEYAIAAVAEDGHVLLNADETRIDQTAFHQLVEAERQEARRRREKYLGTRLPIPVKGKIVVLVDDGIATGLTMKAAIGEIRHRQPRKIVVAVPVAPHEVAVELKKMADEVVTLYDEADFRGAIGAYYEEFPQVTDEEVIEILAKASRR